MNDQFKHMQKLAFGKIITESLNSQNLTESELRNKIAFAISSGSDTFFNGLLARA